MTLVYRALGPRTSSPRPPLLLLLHGIGADEEELLPIAERVDPRFRILSLRAPHPAEPTGRRWYEIDWSVTPARADPAEMVASRDLLARFVEGAAAAHGTDPSRTFLLGFSQGAIMSLALLVARPDLVRGVVAHSGLLARLPGPVHGPEAFSRAEVLLLHGAQDDVVPVGQGRKAQDVLATLLGDRVALRRFEGLGHAISEESAAEATRWLSARLDGGAPGATPG